MVAKMLIRDNIKYIIDYLFINGDLRELLRAILNLYRIYYYMF